jgi:outer membrane protein assembly factor BamE (lipoprotein component of BamABCDE complex)
VRRARLWLFVLILSACASSPKANLQKLRVGMDKDEVLQAAGDPKRTFRANSEDHWIYIYFEGDEEWRRQIDFRDGKVILVGRAIPKKNWQSELEATGTMEEFESKARAHQRKASEFKSIDGE